MSKPEPASMYASAKKIYPREIGGRFDKLSKLATITLLGLFYLVPWLPWDDRQAILFDLPARKFYLLGLTLWPQDFPFLAMLLMILAFSLFFFSADSRVHKRSGRKPSSGWSNLPKARARSA